MRIKQLSNCSVVISTKQFSIKMRTILNRENSFCRKVHWGKNFEKKNVEIDTRTRKSIKGKCSILLLYKSCKIKFLEFATFWPTFSEKVLMFRKSIFLFCNSTNNLYHAITACSRICRNLWTSWFNEN